MDEPKNTIAKPGVENDEEEDSKIFPQKLIEILSDENNAEAICWLPHGKAFTIRNRSLFAEKIMPKFFPRKAKYSSFTRKLNRWNFVRVASGPELGAYYHEFFLRDKPQLAAQMFCKNARSKLAMANEVTLPQQVSNTIPPPPSGSENKVVAEDDIVRPAPSVANFSPAVMAALQKDGLEENGVGFKTVTAPVLGLSGLQLLERQLKFLQEEQALAQRIYLQQLAAKQQLVANHIQQQQLLQMHQQPLPDPQALLRMRRLMELRAMERKGQVPNNGRASAA
ncbi:hypothetical protein ACA910_000196 [Epithemia clementina (nom. ined.)]